MNAQKSRFRPCRKDVDYSVGYGRPPRDTRFRPGISGNPGGRPKGRQNLSTVLGKLARQTMTITEGGHTRRVPRYVALQLLQWSKALNGDHKAFMAIHQSMRDAGLLRAEVETVPPVITDDDQLIIQDYLTRIGVTPNHKRKQKTKRPNKGSNT